MGRQAEQTASEFCLKHAPAEARVLERNWRCRRGEIDLMLLEGATLVFVEIRWRQGAWALESIDARKRRRLEQLARIYLAQYRGKATQVRFDALVGRDGEWEWIRDAWRPGY
jgi:putative endonuclease